MILKWKMFNEALYDDFYKVIPTIGDDELRSIVLRLHRILPKNLSYELMYKISEEGNVLEIIKEILDKSELNEFELERYWNILFQHECKNVVSDIDIESIELVHDKVLPRANEIGVEKAAEEIRVEIETDGLDVDDIIDCLNDSLMYYSKLREVYESYNKSIKKLDLKINLLNELIELITPLYI